MGNKKMTIEIFSDPGHGWAKASFSLIKRLGIEEKISGYSYYSLTTQCAYLEEDGDLGVLVEALKANGFELSFKERVAQNRRSKIRSYRSYNPNIFKVLNIS